MLPDDKKFRPNQFDFIIIQGSNVMIYMQGVCQMFGRVKDDNPLPVTRLPSCISMLTSPGFVSGFWGQLHLSPASPLPAPPLKLHSPFAG